MFIEKRKKGKSIKYYLVHSFRDGKDVVKIRKYLGQNLSNEELSLNRIKAEGYIKERLKRYKRISDPLRYIISKSELKLIEKIKAKRDFRVFHLDERQWKVFSELFSYNTNAIEGSALTQGEVKGLIEKGKIPKKSREDIEEAYGVVEAIKHFRKSREHISLMLIKELHKIVFKNTKTFAGRFREKGVEVVIRDSLGSIVHRGAPSESVERLMKGLAGWYAKNKLKYPPILLAAAVHNEFENIHPFQDGNGRVGRLLMNNILIKHKLPPVNIEFKRRGEYYGSLQAHQNDGDLRPMIDLILKEYKILRKQLKR